eukprot:2478377-Alexandrium_andersonii.AAC.1
MAMAMAMPMSTMMMVILAVVMMQVGMTAAMMKHDKSRPNRPSFCGARALQRQNHGTRSGWSRAGRLGNATVRAGRGR